MRILDLNKIVSYIDYANDIATLVLIYALFLVYIVLLSV